MKFLLIEDDVTAADYLREGLSQFGYHVDVVNDGEQGLERARTRDYAQWLIDVMLPKLDGLSLLRTLREEGDRTPALILSARGEVDDRVAGLRAGGDDYVVKPYALNEVQARIEALLRRAPCASTSPPADTSSVPSATSSPRLDSSTSTRTS